MAERLTLGQKLASFEIAGDRYRILDVEHAVTVHRLLHRDDHWGVFYILPPSTVTANEIREILEEYKDQGFVHFGFNVQSTLGVEHLGVLTPDEFARKYFEKPEGKLIRIQWSQNRAWNELEEIFSQLRGRFDPNRFPSVSAFGLGEYKPPTPNRETLVTLKPQRSEWARLTALEQQIRVHVAECAFAREVFVSRHLVKGRDPEIILTSTERTSDQGQRFLSELAEYVRDHPPTHQDETEEQREAPRQSSSVESFMTIKELTKGNQQAPTPKEIQEFAAKTLGDTLTKMEGFAERTITRRGTWVEIEFPGTGLLGMGGHFGPQEERELRSVAAVVHSSPQLREGWSASYRYDRSARKLRIKVGNAEEQPSDGYRLI